ncbi:unnamed protein product [Cladocopium goreaui]|uniref:O-methyltransferase domain-containing protein n=1 Tax=Cladocopium goreaui TaxID=2562237 RepID=A0A9P1FTG3_9DINO|nr:unnamed protein product [Cladocopium goreaui]
MGAPKSQKYPLTDTVRGIVYEGLTMEETFTKIYATDAWGKGSGAGSVPVHCLKWIEFVRKFIKENAIHSVVDLGCGDWQFSPYIYHDLGVAYTGYDVVLPVIQENRANWGEQGFAFEHLEFSSQVHEVKDAELYILKDVLQHWSSARISSFLKELRRKPTLRFILLCNCAGPEDWPEEDCQDGGWRPLFASKAPLKEFNPEVLLRFPSLPNIKASHALQWQGRQGAIASYIRCPGPNPTFLSNFSFVMINSKHIYRPYVSSCFPCIRKWPTQNMINHDRSL